MAKRTPRGGGTGYHLDPGSSERSLGHGRGNGRDWVDHGGRSIASGPAPGSHGISRSDGPDAAGSGRQGDLRGPPRRPR
jgi:hypothetical protein